MGFAKYERYRESGVEWLGEVPEHWEVKSIKWISPVQRGASPRPIDDAKYFDENGEYAWVRITDVSASDGYLLETTERLSDLGSSLSVKLEPEQLFISIAGTVGKPCITKIKACIHDGFVYFPTLGMNPHWLFKIFEAGLCYGGLGKMGTQLNLNTDTIGSIRIGLPPANEIETILGYLDRETTRIDTLISEQNSLISLLREKRQALISHCVTKGLDRTVKMKESGVEWLGEVPEGWGLKKLKHIVCGLNGFVDGPFGSNLKSEHFVEGGDAYVIESNFGTQGRLVLEELKTITMSHFETIQRSEVKEEDIVIAKIGAQFGKSNILPEIDKPAVVSGNSMKLTVNKNRCSVKWAHLQLVHLKCNGEIDILVNGSAQPALSLGAMRELTIVLPPLSEQKDILNYLNRETTRLDTLISESESTITLMQEHRTALISAAVTGKIKVPGVK